MTAPAATAAGLTALDVVGYAGCTYRMLDHWCRLGLFDAGTPGSGARRRFTDEDAIVAAVLGQVSRALSTPGGSYRGDGDLYRSVAEQVRRGDVQPVIDLGHSVRLVVGTVAARLAFVEHFGRTPA